MGFKRAFLGSIIFHGVLLALLMIQAGRSLKPKNNHAIEAHALFRTNEPDHSLLPRKKQEPVLVPKEKPEAPKSKDQKVEAKPSVKDQGLARDQVVKKEHPVVRKAAKVVKKERIPAHNYARELTSLSAAFAKELEEEGAQAQVEEQDDAQTSYFDQIYTLIKEAFILPPHINGPKGKDLYAVLRLFLASDGSLVKLDVESSSGDEHFDRAIADGTRRVNNFGRVPIGLQNVVRERGIVVTLCPFTCPER